MSLFTDPFLWTALSVGVLGAVLCTLAGRFVLMRGMTFVSIALAEAAAAGAALGMLIHMPPDIAAIVAVLGAIILFRHRGRAGDGAIGILYAGAAAVTLMIISLHPRLEASGVDLLAGNLLYSTVRDGWFMAGAFAVIAPVHILYRKAFLFTAIDPDTARTQGLPARVWEVLLMVTIGLSIAVTIKLAGVLYVFAAMIIPVMAALRMANRVRSVTLVSLVVSVGGVLAGFSASVEWNLPTSPAVILAWCSVYLIARIVSRRSA